ncbi:MAG: hypothetical protein ACLR1D_00710 [Dialister sp.]
MDLFPAGSGENSEELAEITWKLMRKGRFYQLTTEKPDAYHQALAFSATISREDWLKINETQEILHKRTRKNILRRKRKKISGKPF